MGETKKEVTVRVRIKPLLYDIANETYLRHLSPRDGEDVKRAARLYASADAGNTDKLLRSVQRCFAAVRCALSEYMDGGVAEADSSLACGDGDLSLRLSVPGNFSEAALPYLCESVHDYLKNAAIGEWYLVTNPGEAQQYLALSEKSLSGAVSAACSRRRPERPVRQSPNP